MEILGKLRKLVEMTTKRSKATILTEEGETEEFEFNTEEGRGDDVDKGFQYTFGCDN